MLVWLCWQREREERWGGKMHIVNFIHLYAFVSINLYIYICVCVCVYWKCKPLLLYVSEYMELKKCFNLKERRIHEKSEISQEIFNLTS